MKNMQNTRVLIDTNIVIDYIMDREPYANQAEKVVELCIGKIIMGCIAAHTILNLHYVLRKELSLKERKDAILKICKVFTVVGIDAVKITSAIENDNFTDFEDCLQSECAREFNANYIITRNVKDFKNGDIKAIEPSEFLSILEA